MRNSLSALPRKTSEGGIAIVVTLIMVAMFFVLALSFFTTMRSGLKLAKASTDQLRARLAAEAAVNDAISLLIQSTADDDYITFCSNTSWATPSQQRPILQVYSITESNATWVDNLVSGLAEESPDLNRNQIIGSTNYLGRPMKWGWKYLVNGNVTNARYAYWIDDESMKMNIKVAGNQTAIFGDTETQMGMEGIPYLDANSSTNIILNRSSGFETLQGLQRMEPSLAGSNYPRYHETKFFTTIYSRNSQTNYAGRPQLDINSLTNLNVTQIAVALTNAFPLAVVQKYSWQDWLQFSANLKDYVDSDSVPSSDGLTLTDGSDTIPLLGREAVPLIYAVSDEVSLYPPGGQWWFYRALDIYAVNLSSKNFMFPTGCSVYVEGLPTMIASNFYGAATSRNILLSYSNTSTSVPSANSCHRLALLSSGLKHDPSLENSTYLNPYGSALRNNAGTPQNRVIQGYGFSTNIAQIYYKGVMSTTNFSTLNYTGTRFSLLTPSNTIRIVLSNQTGILDEVHIPYDSFPTNFYPPSASYHAGVIFWLRRPGDPRVAKLKSAWDMASYSDRNSGLTFDGIYYDFSDTNWTGPSFVPDQTNTSFYFGDINSGHELAFGDHGFFIRDGPMKSIGEIGQIPIQSLGTSNMWRTLKLYGDGNRMSGVSNSEDFFVLDRIRVGNPVRAKINLNTTKERYQESDGVLSALFRKSSIPLDATGNDSSFHPLEEYFDSLNVSDLSTNLISTAQQAGPYRTLGHYLQQNTLGLDGLTTNQVTSWRREGPLRSIANALTVRGEQFTIYALGQNLKTTANGLQVQGEAYFQTVVERVQTDAAPPHHVFYRALYYRVIED